MQDKLNNFENIAGKLHNEPAGKLHEHVSTAPYVPANDMERRVIAFLCNHFDLDQRQIVPGATLADLGFDSLDAAEAIMAVEEEYGITIPESDDERFTCVADFIAYVSRRLR